MMSISWLPCFFLDVSLRCRSYNVDRVHIGQLSGISFSFHASLCQVSAACRWQQASLQQSPPRQVTRARARGYAQLFTFWLAADFQLASNFTSNNVPLLDLQR